MSYSINTNNPYAPIPSTNALFTFSRRGIYTLDPDTGNYVPSQTQLIQCSATVEQAKDPNLVLQPGIDYNRVYFEGHLVTPRVEPLARNSKGIPAIINGNQGTFDFIPVFITAESIELDADLIVGQRIAGYFTFTS